MKRTTILLTLLAVLVGMLSLPALAASAPYGVSTRGIVPTAIEGNFVAGTDQDVCYSIAEVLGQTETWVTSELKGWKIDPPVNFENEFIKVTLSNGGRELAWEVKGGAEMQAVIVKGGPSFNLYNYVGTSFESDSKLVSPLQKGKTPQISHYNICVKPPVTTSGGCTPGFWKNDTPANRPAWAYLGTLDPTILKTSAFVDPYTFEGALGQTGQNIFWAHASAAYLNASMGAYVGYYYTPSQVMDLIENVGQEGYPATYAELKGLFEVQNEKGCPLSATNPAPGT